MTPTNPDNNKPFIYRIADALGITHLVVAVQHSHLMSEIEGLVAALAGKSDTSHNHKIIQYNPSASTDGFAGFPTTSNGDFVVGVQDNKNISFQFGGMQKAIVTKTNANNLARALQDPDTTPTANSDKLVTSGGVKAALDGKQDALTFDSTPTAGSTNPVTSGGVKAALDGKADKIHMHSAIGDEESSITVGEGTIDIELSDPVTHSGGELNITVSKLPNLQRAINNPDTAPTANSNNLVTSGGVKAALDGKEDIAPKLRVLCSLVGGTKILTEAHQGDIEEFISQIWDDRGNDMAHKMEIECGNQDISVIAQCSYMFHLFTTYGHDRFAFAIVLNNNVYQVNGTVDDYQQGIGFHLDSNYLTYINDIFNFQMQD